MSRPFDHPYAEFLHRVTKPTRYTGAEHGVTRKDWGDQTAKICLAFPDVYDIGMSHLGFRILYDTLNRDPRTLAERCYAPWLDMQGELVRRGLPLVSLESARPLRDFDVVGFSLQYELTYTNILLMLELGGIPRRSAERGDGDPLVLAGGPVATHAEPIAPFIDAFLIGDGEEATGEIALEWVKSRSLGLSRIERLTRLAAIEGVYVPSLYDTAVDPGTSLEVVTGTRTPSAPLPVRRRVVADLERFPFPGRGPVGGPEAVFDRLSIEIARGCTEGCRFCQAGMIYRPVRERDPRALIDTVLGALQASGQDEVSLTALSTADVSCISPLIRRLAEVTAPERVRLGVASLRAYGLAEELLEAMRRVRASGLTFAPEAGTQRLRDVINKNVTEEQLLETAERVFSQGFDKMKLYFILGLPTETDEDVAGIADVGRSTVSVGRRHGKRPTVTVSVSTHVPKPHTPFQWCAMDSLAEIQRKQSLLRGSLRGARGITLRMHDAETSWLEGILARGDRRLADVIERAYVMGARFDSWEDQLDLQIWREALEHCSINTAALLGELPVSGRLPWDHLDMGLKEGFLAREYRLAQSGRLSPPCGKPKGLFVHHASLQEAEADQRGLVCHDCGVACDLKQMRHQRLEYLSRMEATTTSFAVPPAEAAPCNSTAVSPESLRPERSGGDAERWRLCFSKRGPAALLGHLDLVRELPRIVRRAGIRTAYTRGFNPRADMTFSPALSLGIPSLGEYLDLRLLEAPEPHELLERLARAVPPGLAFTRATRLGPNDPSISKIIDEARYAVGFAQDDLDAVTEAPLEELVARFLARPEALVERTVKKQRKMLDVRALCLNVETDTGMALTALREAGVVGIDRCLEVSLRLTPSGATRPAEVVEAVFGQAVAHLAVRSELVARGHSPLDLGSFASRGGRSDASRPEPDDSSCEGEPVSPTADG